MANVSSVNLVSVYGDEFFKVARAVAHKMKGKYYTVCEYFEVNDIVQDAAEKVIKYGIQLEEGRGTLQSLVYRIVSSVYIDKARQLKDKGYTSLDSALADAEDLCYYDVLQSNTLHPEEKVEGEDTYDYIIENLPCTSNTLGDTPLGVLNFSMRSVVLLKSQGYTPNEMSEWFGTRPQSINAILRKSKKVIEDILTY